MLVSFQFDGFFLILCFIRNLLGQTPGISGFLLSWNLWLHFRLVDYQWCQWQVLHWFHSVWNRQNLMQMLQLMSLKKPKMIITGLFNWSNCSIVVSGSPIVAQVRRKKRYCVVIFAPIIVAIILEWWRRIFYKQITFASAL